MAPIHHHDAPPAPHRNRKLNPDPIRASSAANSNNANSKKLAGSGPHRSHRFLHHQRGTIGTFRARLLKGRGLSRKHWSALSLGPARHLGLSKAHGELSSYGTLRLAFWKGGDAGDDGGRVDDREDEGVLTAGQGHGSSEFASASSATSTVESSESSVTCSSASSQTKGADGQHASFLPSMPTGSNQPPIIGNNNNAAASSGKSPLTPLFDQGCIRSLSPAARSPFFPSNISAAQRQHQNQQHASQSSGNQQQSASSGLDPNWDRKPSADDLKQQRQSSTSSSMPLPPSLSSISGATPLLCEHQFLMEYKIRLDGSQKDWIMAGNLGKCDTASDTPLHIL